MAGGQDIEAGGGEGLVKKHGSVLVEAFLGFGIDVVFRPILAFRREVQIAFGSEVVEFFVVRIHRSFFHFFNDIDSLMSILSLKCIAGPGEVKGKIWKISMGGRWRIHSLWPGQELGCENFFIFSIL